MSRNTHSICSKINLSVHDLTSTSVSWIKRRVKRLVTPGDWKCAMVRELLMCRDGDADCGLNEHEINFLLYDLCVN